MDGCVWHDWSTAGAAWTPAILDVKDSNSDTFRLRVYKTFFICIRSSQDFDCFVWHCHFRLLEGQAEHLQLKARVCELIR